MARTCTAAAIAVMMGSASYAVSPSAGPHGEASVREEAQAPLTRASSGPTAASRLSVPPRAAAEEQVRDVSATIEASGRVCVNSHTVTLYQLRNVIRADAQRASTIRVHIAAEADVSQERIDAIKQQIMEAGVRADHITIRHSPVAAAPRHNPRAFGLLLRRVWPAARRTAGAIAADESRIAHEMEVRGDSLRSRLETIERLIADWVETAPAASRPTGTSRAARGRSPIRNWKTIRGQR
jgi:biopolymer transport protein ExbD